MWAFGCGIVSTGVEISPRAGTALLGVLVAGPLVCGASQVVNDWFDRHVDAINEPGRPIPSGRLPGRWGLGLALLWTALSLGLAVGLGPWGWSATAVALALAWAYSAPPLRLKRNGWWGNAAVGFCYEGLAWVTGAATMLGGAAPDERILLVAVLYSLGAHGIMTLNDFKSVASDLRMGIGSLPARLGVDRAARVACATMLLPQLAVGTLLLLWNQPTQAGLLGLLVTAQLPLMLRLLQRPAARALWYSAVGVPFYVLGMLATAFALR